MGLRANAAQFPLLVVINAQVGGMVEQQHTVLPLLATDVFGLSGSLFATHDAWLHFAWSPQDV